MTYKDLIYTGLSLSTLSSQDYEKQFKSSLRMEECYIWLESSISDAFLSKQPCLKMEI